jgi:RHS repeat-associated protein
VYDDDNRLIEVKNASGTTIASFNYDHLGRRISKTTSNGTIYYHYDGDSNRVLYETDANNNIVAEYTWDVHDLPVTMTRNGTTYYYHVNGHGDVTALTDSSGNVVAEYSYDAWGNILSQTGAMASANPYRYAGYYYDTETGLYYLMARYYDANIGRFITRDTFHGFEDEPLSLNQYIYTHNNPVIFTDPNGHAVFSWNRFKKSLKYAFTTRAAQYFGWDTAEDIIQAIPALLEKAYRSYQSVLSGYKLNKSLYTVFKDAFSKTILGTRAFRDKLLSAVKSAARKQGTKLALKGIAKAAFGYVDIGVFTGALAYGYIWKYRHVK